MSSGQEEMHISWKSLILPDLGKDVLQGGGLRHAESLVLACALPYANAVVARGVGVEGPGVLEHAGQVLRRGGAREPTQEEKDTRFLHRQLLGKQSAETIPLR